MNAISNLFQRKSDTPAADALRAALAERAKVQAEANRIEGERSKRDRAVTAAEDERKRLVKLREAHNHLRAEANARGTSDPSRAQREAEIAAADKRHKELASDAVEAEGAFRILTADLVPVLGRLRDIDARLVGLERDALLEQLDAAAEEHQRAHAAYFASVTRVFALAHAATARGAVVGAGLEAHLVMPHPERPAFKGCEIPRDFRLVIQSEARKILEGLRRD